MMGFPNRYKSSIQEKKILKKTSKRVEKFCFVMSVTASILGRTGLMIRHCICGYKGRWMIDYQ
jgi:hypothetical protein